MSKSWFMFDEFDGFPRRCRWWIAWCRHGLKHRNGTSVGGGYLFRWLRRWLQWMPAGKDNYWPVKSRRLSSPIVVDLLDLQTYIHTVPVLSRGSNEFDLQTQLLDSGMVFLDIGANYGLYTLHASDRVGPSGRVVACEPQPRLVGALQESQRLLAVHNVLVIPSAVSDRPGRAVFENSSMASGSGSLVPGGTSSGDAHVFQVDVITVDDLCRQHGIDRVDLVKIDVEGGEYKALSGAAEIIRKCRPVLWFELNPEALSRAGVAIPSMFRLLADLGYVEFRRVVRGYPKIDPAGEFAALENVLALPAGRARDGFPAALPEVRR